MPGTLVTVEGLDLVFGARGKVSPYDALLDELAVAGQGKALKFGDVRAKTAVLARAKRKGLRVSFAYSGSALYVRCDGRVDDDIKANRRKALNGGTVLSRSECISTPGLHSGCWPHVRD